MNTAPRINHLALDSANKTDKNGCYTLNGVEARWASGAKKQMTELKLCGEHRRGYTVTLNRPSDHPNLEKDLAVEIELLARADSRNSRSIPIHESLSSRQAMVEQNPSLMSRGSKAGPW
ncbi:MAG: hypothetical protein GKR91_12775 [Pseudomonadales bacterium]|nr:hypothetical protein [Pseudomonadales bacterium]